MVEIKNVLFTYILYTQVFFFKTSASILNALKRIELGYIRRYLLIILAA